MTAKEKAKYLVSQMAFHQVYNKRDKNESQLTRAKGCALIAVNEILEAARYTYTEIKYWKSVKTEIEKL